jgi:hypothetical protein
MRGARTLGVVASGVALAFAAVAPATAGDRTTTVTFTQLQHRCATPDRFSVKVTLNHAVKGAVYKLLGYTASFAAHGTTSFVSTGTTFTHRETIKLDEGTLPVKYTTMYFTLYHHRKAADTQLTYDNPHKTLPHCT